LAQGRARAGVLPRAGARTKVSRPSPLGRFRAPERQQRQQQRRRLRVRSTSEREQAEAEAAEVVEVEVVDAEAKAGPSAAAKEEAGGAGGSLTTASLAGTGGVAVLGLGLLIALGVAYKDDIYTGLTAFSALLEEWGPFGYVAYAGAYIVLEVLAVPAIPLTMTAGVLFGPLLGSVIVSFSATAAATVAFLIARYVARDRVLEIAQKNEKFAAIDKAIGKESFKVVLFLRLSPLLPFALSNYLYGLTSVDLGSYVLGSWLGMFPGTFAYVSAGNVSKSVLEQTSGGAGGGDLPSLAPLIFGVGGTLLATTFISRIVMKTLKELDIE